MTTGTPALVISSGSRAGERVLLERELTVGREDADFVIADDAEASRRHATLRPVAGGVEVVDLGSLNGTTVDGARIEGPRVAGNGSTIKIGATSFTVELALADPEVTRAAPIVPQGSERTVVRSTPDPRPTAAGQEQPAPDLQATSVGQQQQPAGDLQATSVGQQQPSPPSEAPAAEEAPPEQAPPEGAQPPGPPAPVRALLGFMFGAGPEKIPKRMAIVVLTWTLTVAALTVLIYSLVS